MIRLSGSMSQSIPLPPLPPVGHPHKLQYIIRLSSSTVHSSSSPPTDRSSFSTTVHHKAELQHAFIVSTFFFFLKIYLVTFERQIKKLVLSHQPNSFIFWSQLDYFFGQLYYFFRACCTIFLGLAVLSFRASCTIFQGQLDYFWGQLN